MGYVDAISELIDFRKVNGASDAVLRKLEKMENLRATVVVF